MGGFRRKARSHQVGDIFAHAGAVAPRGALVCDGERYAVADYAKLFAKIGHAYALGGDDTGDGNFRLPAGPFFRQAAQVTITPEFLRGAGNYDLIGTAGVDMTRMDYTPYGLSAWNDGFTRPGVGAESKMIRYKGAGDTQRAGMWIVPFLLQLSFTTGAYGSETIAIGVGSGTAAGWPWTDSAPGAIVEIDVAYGSDGTFATGCRGVQQSGAVDIYASAFPPAEQLLGMDVCVLTGHIYLDYDAGLWGVMLNGRSNDIGPLDTYADALGPVFGAKFNAGGGNQGVYVFQPANSALSGSTPIVYDVSRADYSNYFQPPSVTGWGVGATGGAASHDHGGAVSGHALTMEELPTIAQGTDPADSTNNNKLLGDYDPASSIKRGGGQEHAHAIASASNLPPYTDILYCIQYR